MSAYIILYSLTENKKLREVYMNQYLAKLRRKNMLPTR